MIAAVIKVVAVLLIAAALSVTIGAQKPEYAFVLSLACGVAVALFLIDMLFEPVAEIKALFERSGGIAPYFAVALKSLGIAYITGFAADTCRDFGQSALGAKAEFAGRCAIFILCVPLAVNVLKAALKFSGI